MNVATGAPGGCEASSEAAALLQQRQRKALEAEEAPRSRVVKCPYSELQNASFDPLSLKIWELSKAEQKWTTGVLWDTRSRSLQALRQCDAALSASRGAEEASLVSQPARLSLMHFSGAAAA